MLFWNDFDRRATKVFCDNCEANITHAVQEALGPKPDQKSLVIAGGSNCETMVKQTVFYFKGSKYVFMEFHVGDRQKPSPRKDRLFGILKRIYSELRGT